MWNLSFISEADFTAHVRATIEKYGDKLESFDLDRFNKNIVDPIKLIFDKTVYRTSWEETIGNENFSGRGISQTTMILAISIREYLVILQTAMCLKMARKVAGMLYIATPMVSLCRTARLFTPYTLK